eukprot:19658-Heterococcus_DN1.PRE.1
MESRQEMSCSAVKNELQKTEAKCALEPPRKQSSSIFLHKICLQAFMLEFHSDPSALTST